MPSWLGKYGGWLLVTGPWLTGCSMWKQVGNQPLPKQVTVEADQHWEKSNAELVREILANPPKATASEPPVAQLTPVAAPQPPSMERVPQREEAYAAQPAASSRIPSLAEGELMHLQPLGSFGQRAFREEQLPAVQHSAGYQPRLAEYIPPRQPESQLTLASVHAVPQPPAYPPPREEIPAAYVPPPVYQPTAQPVVPTAAPTNVKPEQPVKLLGVVENARGQSVAMLDVSGQGTVLTRAGERVMIEQPSGVVVLRVEAVERGVVYLRDEQLNKVLILR